MASKYIKKYPLRLRFQNILNDFTKEIMRNQPEDIIDFGVEYFKSLEEGKVLNYQKKRKNIPCDYEPKIPVKPKIHYAYNKMNMSVEDKERLKTSIESIEGLKKYEVPLREEKFGTREGFGPIVNNPIKFNQNKEGD